MSYDLLRLWMLRLIAGSDTVILNAKIEGGTVTFIGTQASKRLLAHHMELKDLTLNTARCVWGGKRGVLDVFDFPVSWNVKVGE